MKYLMFVYGESETMDSEAITTKIGKELQPIAMSDQIKYIYGDGNAVFHFETDLKFEEMTIYCDILIDELPDFMYILIPFNGILSSNAGKERVDHLLNLGKKKKKPNKNSINFDNFEINESAMFDMFINIVNETNPFNITDQEVVCNMSLDELLDKINEQGIKSLTTAERQKLEQYSK